MGLFSKLFQTANDTERAEKMMRDLFGGNQNTQQQKTQPAPQQQSYPANNQPAPRQQVSNSPSGFSWGELMPNEENQFNYNGNYQQYFESIFFNEFRYYEIRTDRTRYSNMPVYTFIKNGRTALVVELMSQKSSAKKLRDDCERSGIPYLRYYIDHAGWWNTKKYVITRTRNALAF